MCMCNALLPDVLYIHVCLPCMHDDVHTCTEDADSFALVHGIVAVAIRHVASARQMPCDHVF